MNEVKENIAKLYPAAFETLTYHNYKAKFHTLLFMDEIEVSIKYTSYKETITTFYKNFFYIICVNAGLIIIESYSLKLTLEIKFNIAKLFFNNLTNIICIFKIYNTLLFFYMYGTNLVNLALQ